jgi:hypothetical protein
LGSLRPDPELLDYWPPLRDIGLLQIAEKLGRLLFARENLKPERADSKLNAAVVETLAEAGASLGVPFGAKNPVQEESVRAGSPISLTVGMSGANANRVSLIRSCVLATIRIFDRSTRKNARKAPEQFF